MKDKNGKKTGGRTLRTVRTHLMLFVLGCFVAIVGLLRTHSPMWLVVITVCLWFVVRRLQEAALLTRTTEGAGPIGVSARAEAAAFTNRLSNRVLVYVVLIVGVFTAALTTLNRSGGGTDAVPSRQSPHLDPSGLNRCFAKGSDIAEVYFANAKTAIESRVMPSEMRDNGCRRITAEIGSADRDCMGQCVAGFSYQAKKLVKGVE